MRCDLSFPNCPVPNKKINLKPGFPDAYTAEECFISLPGRGGVAGPGAISVELTPTGRFVFECDVPKLAPPPPSPPSPPPQPPSPEPPLP